MSELSKQAEMLIKNRPRVPWELPNAVEAWVINALEFIEVADRETKKLKDDYKELDEYYNVLEAKKDSLEARLNRIQETLTAIEHEPVHNSPPYGTYKEGWLDGVNFAVERLRKKTDKK